MTYAIVSAGFCVSRALQLLKLCLVFDYVTRSVSAALPAEALLSSILATNNTPTHAPPHLPAPTPKVPTRCLDISFAKHPDLQLTDLLLGMSGSWLLLSKHAKLCKRQHLLKPQPCHVMWRHVMSVQAFTAIAHATSRS